MLKFTNNRPKVARIQELLLGLRALRCIKEFMRTIPNHLIYVYALNRAL